jgi:hypothetical protein
MQAERWADKHSKGNLGIFTTLLGTCHKKKILLHLQLAVGPENYAVHSQTLQVPITMPFS